MPPSPLLQRAPRTRRTAVAIVAIAVLTTVLTSCLPTKIAVSGKRCTGSGLARNKTHILQCKKGRWTRIKTINQFVAEEQAAAEVAAQAVRDKAAADAAAVAALTAEWARQTGVNERAAAMRGTGTWVDVYDWSPTFTNFKSPGARPPFTLDRIDRMADNGIATLYIQTAKAELPDPVLDRDLLLAIITKARSRGMRVIGWYLPTFVDKDADQAHIAATIATGVDGFGLDIESTATELGARNQRLIEMSAWLRASFPTTPLAAIVLPPVVTDIINTAYWPSFPWAQIAQSYDVWMPMSYWTNRRADSGWRDGYRYTWENIDRMRASLGLPAAVVHPIGGLSDTATAAEIDGFVQASLERGAIGGSLYDDGISTTEQYQQLGRLAKP